MNKDKQMEKDFLQFLKDLSKEKSYEVRLDTPMGEDYVNMIKSPEYKLKMLMMKYFPEELI